MAVLAVIVGGYVLIRWVHWDADAVAAVATAAAAVAAFASADSSANAARDSVRALSYATKPRIDLHVRQNQDSLTVQVVNDSTNPIGSCTLSWTLRDGSTGSRVLGSLAGYSFTTTGLSIGAQGPSYPTVEITPNPGRKAGTDEYRVAFAGVQGSLRWRSTFQITHERDATSDIGGTQRQAQLIEEREM
ncbi:hypothetical protein [Curtobacterium sp. ME26]|uniref:hypothetical protein n=1 Tax=Curtobacterium sp. ME26 TaxID=2744254 RepID=UPI0015F42790|nr:hypothetical protein [Curtobacterium sp. ME26]